MSPDNFLSKQNVGLLFEVIFENNIFHGKSETEVNKMKNLTAESISLFFEKEKGNYKDLISLNKKFITNMITQINTYFNSRSNSNNNNIRPSSNTGMGINYNSQPQNTDSSVTYQEIQEKRKSQFEKDLQTRQNDFMNAMTLPVPPTPNFSDNRVDGKIEEMDMIVKKMISERNYDLENIHNNSSNKIHAETWLKPAETSIKTERTKEISAMTGGVGGGVGGQSLSYIKIDSKNLENGILKNDIIDLNEKKKPNISWEDQQMPITDNIFSKLKKTNANVSDNTEKDSLEHELIENVDLKILDEKFKGLKDEIKSLKNTLETYMERCNSTMTLIYNLVKNQQIQTHTSANTNN